MAAKPTKTTITLSDVKTVSHGYDNIWTEINKYYPETRLTPDDIKSLKPLVPAADTSYIYHLHGINTDLANGWRRVMVDEFVHPRFTCLSLSDIVSTDERCQRLTDYITDRIRLVPTSFIAEQPLQPFRIDIRNGSAEILTVTSADIRYEGKDKCPIQWNQRCAIIELYPGKSIQIKIVVDWGINHRHGSFAKLGPCTYRPLDYKEPYPPSYREHPTAYQLGIRTHSLIDPKWATVHGWKTLRGKVANALEQIERWTDGVLPYQTPRLEISVVGDDQIQYKFIAETRTLVNILAWYCYTLDKSIALVRAGDNHPEDQFRTLIITHPTHSKVVASAARTAIADIDAIIALF